MHKSLQFISARDIENSAEILKSLPVTTEYNEASYVVEGLPETVDVTLIGSKTTAIWMENNNGTITAKVLGEKPNADMTVQVTITEVKE